MRQCSRADIDRRNYPAYPRNKGQRCLIQQWTAESKQSGGGWWEHAPRILNTLAFEDFKWFSEQAKEKCGNYTLQSSEAPKLCCYLRKHRVKELTTQIAPFKQGWWLAHSFKSKNSWVIHVSPFALGHLIGTQISNKLLTLITQPARPARFANALEIADKVNACVVVYAFVVLFALVDI